jgi:hypothetical protein
VVCVKLQSVPRASIRFNRNLQLHNRTTWMSWEEIMRGALQLIFLVVVTVSNSAFADTTAYRPEGCNQPLQVTDRSSKRGSQLAEVYCGFGRTCNDGETCCLKGISASCCSKDELCNLGMCVPRPPKKETP